MIKPNHNDNKHIPYYYTSISQTEYKKCSAVLFENTCFSEPAFRSSREYILFVKQIHLFECRCRRLHLLHFDPFRSTERSFLGRVFFQFMSRRYRCSRGSWCWWWWFWYRIYFFFTPPLFTWQVAGIGVVWLRPRQMHPEKAARKPSAESKSDDEL